MDKRQPAVLVSLLAMTVTAAWLAVYLPGFLGSDWSGLFLHGNQFRLPPVLDEKRPYRIAGQGYDGQFYRLIAHDPWFEKGYSGYLDVPRLRYRRILLPALAWMAALGNESRIDTAYCAISLAFLGLGAYWSARIATHLGYAPAYGLLFLAIPGVIVSIHRMLVDGPLLSLTVGFAYYAMTDARRKMTALLVAASLCRETGALLATAWAISLAIRREYLWAIAAAACLLPTIAWWTFVARHVSSDAAFIGMIPFQGLAERFLTPTPYNETPVKRLIVQTADFLSLLGVAAAIVCAALMLQRDFRNPIVLATGLFALLAAGLKDAQATWADPYGYARTLGPLLLLPAIWAVQQRDWRFAIPIMSFYPWLATQFATPVLRIGRWLLG